MGRTKVAELTKGGVSELLVPTKVSRYACIVVDAEVHGRLRAARLRLKRSLVSIVKALLVDGLDRLEKLERKEAERA